MNDKGGESCHTSLLLFEQIELTGFSASATCTGLFECNKELVFPCLLRSSFVKVLSNILYFSNAGLLFLDPPVTYKKMKLRNVNIPLTFAMSNHSACISC